MKKTVLTYGLISGGIAAVLIMLTTWRLKSGGETDSGYVYGYVGITLSLLLVFFGIRSYRDNVSGGKISFGKAFYVGIVIALISSVCYVISWLIISHFFFPDFTDKYIEAQLQKLNDSGLSPAELAEKQESINKMGNMMKNPVTNALMVFMEPFPVGILITLISSFILKRRQPKTV